ncbi:tRNA(Met) cytidine acetyltransferase [Alteromonas pelagimontana]|uniref:tRNA(Met) cytidine acetyltransferase n=1 Tax=Alteromonas pelagimontana TaxID=1858656 RepID=A0A6M4M9V6_9ALTE|nr:GNAT family N-acetyltransferase [Alteromonas pelagimontana]QJR79943.1 tRNA(Met) cytidine acetyltransferase [Alteromonas pelagimontana]
MTVNKVTEWLNRSFTERAYKACHRQLLLISGNSDMCYEDAKAALSGCAVSAFQIAWLGEKGHPAFINRPIRLFKQMLGREFDIAVYDAHEALRPSALLALSGTVRQGGTLIILCPAFELWPEHCSVTTPHYLSYGYNLSHSAYISYLISQFTADRRVAIWTKTQLHLPIATTSDSSTGVAKFKSIDQSHCYKQLLTYFRGKQSCSHVVLTAPRGRGKSSVIGIALNTLIRHGQRVHVTSPVHQSVNTLFDKLENTETTRVAEKHILHSSSGGYVKWVASDNPELFEADSTHIVIDEASSLPLPILEKFLHSGKSCIFSTTTFGYEGSGQGFINRFVRRLTANNQALHLIMSTPIRWYANDPVESRLNSSMLFQSGVENSEDLPATNNFTVSSGQLSELPVDVMKQALALLDAAHYQTSPDDMMRLVDAPDNLCFIMKIDERVVGAAIINAEGGPLLESVAEDIANGKRRVKGHLSAQALSLFYAIPALAIHRYWRINRIAISANLQRSGLGTAIINQVLNAATAENIDILTSSFGLTSSLDLFWKSNGFRTLKIGAKQDKSSGASSALVGRSLTANGKDALSLVLQLRAAEETLVSDYPVPTISPSYSANHTSSQSLHTSRLAEFAAGSRSIHHLGASLHWLVLSCRLRELPPFTIVEDYLNQEAGLSELLTKYKLTGKAALVAELRKNVASYIQRISV